MVISASPQDWQTLKQIIDDLDTPRVQIFVQAVIVEVSAERQRDIGVSFFSDGLGGGSAFCAGAINFGQLQNALGDPLSVTGLGLGLAGNTKCPISPWLWLRYRQSPARPQPAGRVPSWCLATSRL